MKQFLIGLIIVLIFSACSSSEAIQETVVEVPDENELNIYLVNSQSDELVEYCIEVDKSSVNAQVTAVLMALQRGSIDQDLHPTIPQDDLIETYEFDGKGVKVNMSQTIDQISEVELILCRSSLIKSLTGIEGVDYVEFYIDGLPMKDSEGKVYGPFSKNDIVTTVSGDAYGNEMIEVTFYYPDNQGQYLVPIQQTVTIKNTEDMEYAILQKLMDVPEGYEVYSPFPEGSVIKSVNVAGNVAYIDMNEAFKLNHYGGSTGEIMTIYSIVNTLTERRDISRVQFLIEGIKTTDFKGHVDFSELFEFNISLLEIE